VSKNVINCVTSFIYDPLLVIFLSARIGTGPVTQAVNAPAKEVLPVETVLLGKSWQILSGFNIYLCKNLLNIYIQSNLCTTTTLGTHK
jgi:hypothetical protein